jgi:hypothetical protein
MKLVVAIDFDDIAPEAREGSASRRGRTGLLCVGCTFLAGQFIVF